MNHLRLPHALLGDIGTPSVNSRNTQLELDKVLQLQYAVHDQTMGNNGQSFMHGADLFDFLQQVVFVGSAGVLFGPTLGTTQCLADFKIFDQAFPILMSSLPAWLTRKARQARDRLATLVGHVPTPEAADFIVARHRELYQLYEMESGKDFSVGTNQVGMLWATQANTLPTAFWAVYYILRTPAALTAVRKEFEELQASQAEGCDSLLLLPKATSALVAVNSCLNETLRLTGCSIIIREVSCFFFLPAVNRL